MKDRWMGYPIHQLFDSVWPALGAAPDVGGDQIFNPEGAAQQRCVPQTQGGKRMRRALIVLMVFAMALALGTGPASAEQKVIKIGALYPLTGNLAATFSSCR